jgi:hypothetical protein
VEPELERTTLLCNTQLYTAGYEALRIDLGKVYVHFLIMEPELEVTTLFCTTQLLFLFDGIDVKVIKGSDQVYFSF